MTVAVKVLNLQQPGASKSFMAECDALKNVRHRNLVRVITACSSVDYQGHDFKALLYEFMHGESLESWSHNNEHNHDGVLKVRNLSLLQTVNIALDVAAALEYLHHDCEVPIVHRDLKPSYVLLDNEMVAHVGDFGLANFLPQPSHPNHNSSTGVKGSIGYAAPGKRPTDIVFKEGLNLHNYVKMALPDQIVHIIDPTLLEDVGSAPNYIRNPRQAMTWMNTVVSEWHVLLKDSLIQARAMLVWFCMSKE